MGLTARVIFNSPQGLALIAVLIWSFSVPVARALAIQSSYLTVFLSQFFAFLFFLILRKAKGSAIPSPNLYRLEVFLAGLIGHAGYWIFLLEAIDEAGSASLPALLSFSWPCFTIFFSEVFFHKPSGRPLIQIAAGFFSLAGIVLACLNQDLAGLSTYVVLFGLLSGASYGIFSAFSAGHSFDDQIDLLLLASGVSCLVMLPPIMLGSANVWDFSVKDLWLIVLLGIFSEGLGSVAWLRAARISVLKGVPISKAASTIYLLPPASLALISIIYGEKQITQPNFIIGVILITVSIILSNKSGSL